MKKLCFLITVLFGCREAYNPPVANKDLKYLVVEGNITPSGDSTFIQLSRSIAMDSAGEFAPENNAAVIVEGDNGSTYNLTGAGNGYFVAPPLNLDMNVQYRLHIKTGDGKEYVSDFIPVTITPPIDSVSYEYNSKGDLNIYANAHGAENSSRYFKYNYVETWQHNASYYSELLFHPEDSTITKRTADQIIYYCWTVAPSFDINLVSTSGLSGNVVSKDLLVSIPAYSEKLSLVYSIIVSQYALSKQAYNFWYDLRQNSDRIGSLFDPQPFSNLGNIHCLNNPGETVIGFITANTVAQKRIYIRPQQINWQLKPSYCQDSVVHNYIPYFVTFQPIPLKYDIGNLVLGTGYECADCRAHGGSTIKPPYMP